MHASDTPSQYLYKIVSVEQWNQSQGQQMLVLDAMDAEFIHLASAEQVLHVVEKFWRGRDYVILTLASDKLQGCLILERNPGGSTKYYHLYDGDIPLDAVVTTKVVRSQVH